MTLKYLITGATGGLGSQVLSYLIANVPSSEYAAASSSEANRKRFEDQGIAFRVVNYEDPKGLETAFEDVENLLFVSTNTFDVAKRERQHRNFVDAAKKMNVKHVCLTIASPALLKIFHLIRNDRCGIRRSPLAGSGPPRRMCKVPIC
jgi:uncharacterized protein YbjT (DUF2867 family)